MGMKRDRRTFQAEVHALSVPARVLGTRIAERLSLKELAKIAISVLLGLTSAQIEAQTANRDQIQLHYRRAEQALRANQTSEASNEFREILKIDPRNAEACANLG